VVVLLIPASEAMHRVRCDYDLQGVAAGACPECGRAFDPANPETWSASPAFKRRRLERAAIVIGCLAAPGPLWTAWLIGLEYLAARAWLGREPRMYWDNPYQLGPLVRVLHGAATMGCWLTPMLTWIGVVLGAMALARRERYGWMGALLATAGLAYPASIGLLWLYPKGAMWWWD
jgi:hypothetical protein